MSLNPLLSTWSRTRRELQRRYSASGFSCQCCMSPTCQDINCPGRGLHQGDGGAHVDTKGTHLESTLQGVEPVIWAVIVVAGLVLVAGVARAIVAYLN